MREKDGDTDAVLNQGISAGSNLGHFEYFVVFILLAISSLTLTWRAESQAMAASDSFFASAMNHLQLMVEVHEIQTLQTSLLLAHYAHMSPEKVDNWICISNAIRIVLDLGLHRQPPKMIDAEKAEMRRQLFWVTYGMERSMCGILRLPLSFPEESITVQVDYSIENPTQDASSTDNCLRKESSANHIYLYRALETEVHRVLHLRETVPFLLNADLTSWFTSINERLTAWHTKARAYSVHQMLEFRDVQYSHLRAKIHRPCPLLRTRTHEDRKICLEACQMLVEDYQRQAQHRRLFYPWHGVHILFEAAVIMLDACWSSRDWTDLRQQARFILSITLPDCLGLLAKVGERWHEAALCGDHLKPVVEEVAKALSERVVGGLEGGMGLDEEMEKREEATTEKLRQLLFPDGPLAWNARTEGTVGGIDEGASLGLDALPPIPGFEDFQWDGNWDLADLLYESVQ
jgi:predicted nucleic acid-binding Zn ribbon protein